MFRILFISSIAFIGLYSDVANAEQRRAKSDTCHGILAEVGEPALQGDHSDTYTKLCRAGYVLLHDNSKRVPLWVVEEVVPDNLEKNFDRKELGDPFAADSDLAEEDRAKLADYKSSGYDRGHMAPAGDMTWNEDALRESFLLSNMAPQIGPRMNRGIWARLEDRVRTWAESRKRLIVMTGPVFISDDPETIRGRVAIPDAFYKIVYEPRRHRAIAFEMPNEEITEKDLSAFIVSIDDIEDVTGLDFLTALSKRSQRAIESEIAPLWAR